MDEKSSSALVPNKDHLQLNLEISPSKRSNDSTPKLPRMNGNKNILIQNNSMKKLNNNFNQNSGSTLIHHNIHHFKPQVKYQNLGAVAGGGTGGNSATMLIQQQCAAAGNISKESSVSSCLSDATTASSMTPTSTISSDHVKQPKSKILTNSAAGTKHTTLKR